jgi:hypothetical protein
MQTIKSVVVFCVLSVSTSIAFARDLSKKEHEVCNWGAEIASTAQRYKLAGLTLYGARKKIQARHFPQQWMRMSALGITEQTYDSPSRLRPQAVRQVYYEGCARHELARR